MKTAFVTGANGHIGANVCRELVGNGYEVTAMVREGADLRGLEGVDVAVVRGDVLDEASLAPVERAELLFHLAAPYAVWAKDPDSIIAPAVRGTENVLRRARGARRIVVTGSCNAVGFTRGAPLDESSWRAHAESPYMRAKLEQERRAFALADELGLDLVTVLPTTVLGPYDYKRTPTTGPFVDLLLGKSPIPFGMNLVDVRDVAQGHRLAAECGRKGERYLLGGDNLDVRGMATLIEELNGKRPGEKMPPPFVLGVVAAVAEAVSRISGKTPMITRALLADVGGGAPLFDISKAKRELGYAPRDAREVLSATIEWAQKMGWIPAARAREATGVGAAAI